MKRYIVSVKIISFAKKAIRYIISNNSILHEKIYPDTVTKIPNLSTIIYFEKFEHKKFRWYVLPWRVSSETVIFIPIPSKQRHELNVNIFWLFLTILGYASTHNILRLIQTIIFNLLKRKVAAACYVTLAWTRKISGNILSGRFDFLILSWRHFSWTLFSCGNLCLFELISYPIY